MFNFLIIARNSMAPVNWVRKVVRPLIFPEKEVMTILSKHKLGDVLDVGCSNGAFIDRLAKFNIIKKAVGIELDSYYWGKLN